VFAIHISCTVIQIKKRKHKMWSKKWYLKRNISCYVHLLNELLEMDDAIMESAGKLRKLWDSLSELRNSLRERRLERTVMRPALLPAKTAQFTQLFRQVCRHTVKLLSLTESIGRLIPVYLMCSCQNKLISPCLLHLTL
jgi:hypothetical protein